MEGHEFLTAHFSDNERTIIESYWTTPDGKETRVNYIEARENDPQYQHLLTVIDIDTLHENTYTNIRNASEQFERDVVAIAKERGMIYDIDAINTDLYKAIAACLFSPFDPKEDKEKLFMFKLQLFEVEEIKNSTDKKLKSNLRKSKSIIEATKVAIQIVENTSDTTE